MIPKYPPPSSSLFQYSTSLWPPSLITHVPICTCPLFTQEISSVSHSQGEDFLLTLHNFLIYYGFIFYVMANVCMCISVCVSSAFSLALSLSLLFLLSYFCLFLLFCVIIFRSLFVYCWEGEKERRIFGWWGYGKDLGDVLRGLFVS